LALAEILPVRLIKDPQNNIKRYRTIRASIKEVGMIEPLEFIRRRVGLESIYCWMGICGSSR